MLTRYVAVCHSEVFSTRTQLISHYGTTKLNKQNHGTTKPLRSWWKLMQEHCSNALKHDTPGRYHIVWFMVRSQSAYKDNRLTESFVATMICGWSSMADEMLGCLVVCVILIACETSCAFSSSKKCCRVTE